MFKVEPKTGTIILEQIASMINFKTTINDEVSEARRNPSRKS
ncbi:unnamed protein product, partial [Heterotrigona itama]